MQESPGSAHMPPAPAVPPMPDIPLPPDPPLPPLPALPPVALVPPAPAPVPPVAPVPPAAPIPPDPPVPLPPAPQTQSLIPSSSLNAHTHDGSRLLQSPSTSSPSSQNLMKSPAHMPSSVTSPHP